MRCKNCEKPISQHEAGNPSRPMWFSPVPGKLGDVWCDGPGPTVWNPPRHHEPDHGIPDLSVPTDVAKWLDA